MASWKLSLLVVTSLVLALTLQSEAHRRRGRRNRQYEVSEPETDEAVPTDDANDGNAVVTIDNEQGGGRRGGGRGGRRGGGDRGRGGRRGGEGRRRGGAGGSRGRRPGGRRRPQNRPRPRPNNAGRRGNRFSLSSLTPEQQTMAQMALSQAVNQFSVSLYSEVASRNADNFVFSPLSVLTAFSMLELGAAGRTKVQLRNALSIPRTPPFPMVIKIYNSGLEDMNSTGTQSSLANAVYTKPGFNIKRRYVGGLRRFFDSSLEEFAETNPEEPINDWVESQTEGEIHDFLPNDFITADTMMVLVNAIYFKGRWADPFRESSTRFGSFSVSDQQTHQVMMMSRDGDVRVFDSATLSAQVLELPYEGDRYAFYIVLPYQGTELSLVEARFTGDLLNTTLTLTSEQSPSRYTVTIPKFSLDARENMKEILQAQGVQEVFTPEANLRKIYRSQTGEAKLFVSEALHRSVIVLDEEGTVASGATGVSVNVLSLPPSFVADRPFAFVLRDKVKGVNLFIGRFVNPMGSNLKV